MENVYHGSSVEGLKILEPRKSTHGNYVYATSDKILALVFSGRCGDDMVCGIGHYDVDKDSPWQIVERIPGAFDKMFSNSSSIYILPSESFKDIKTGFMEVVSEIPVEVLKEEKIDNVYYELMKKEKEGLITLYRYPNKPKNFESVISKLRHYKKDLNIELKKEEFDRAAYLHPKYLDELNDLSIELGYDYSYTSKDVVNIFKKMIDKQLQDPSNECYIESAYISICMTFPYLKDELSDGYNSYIDKINNIKKI